MPLTEKGEKIRAAMKKQYGKEKGEQVFYASENKGTVSGVHRDVETSSPKMPMRPAGVSRTPAPVEYRPTSQNTTARVASPLKLNSRLYSQAPPPRRSS